MKRIMQKSDWFHAATVMGLALGILVLGLGMAPSATIESVLKDNRSLLEQRPGFERDVERDDEQGRLYRQ